MPFRRHRMAEWCQMVPRPSGCQGACDVHIARSGSAERQLAATTPRSRRTAAGGVE